ncbi:Multi-sensor signal transduction histidine kinase [Verrucomicrobia bacterium]|nr:Multi-sensor signal transduction histidine kinase [Verrucomicrobiota bacterium]
MNWPLENRIRAGFGATLVLLLVLGVVAYWGATSAIRTYRWVDQTHKVLEELERTLVSMLEAQTDFDEYLLGGDPHLLQAHQSAVQSALHGLETLRALTRDNARQQADLDRLQPLLGKQAAWMSAQLEKHGSGEGGAGPQSGIAAQEEHTLANIQQVIGEMEARQRQLLKDRSARAQSEAYATIVVGVFGSAVTIAVAALASLFVHRGFAKQQQAEASIRRLNADLEQQSAQLKNANRELEAFSYSVSHDLRSPLRAIEGFSSALEEDCGERLGPQGQEDLQRVRAAAKRMSELIEDLLALARVTRAELRHAQVDLSNLAQGIVVDLKKAEPERRVELSIAPQVVVEADASLMRVALENLLSNAWKFTGRVEHARIEFGATVKESESVYYVRDNGAGFDMAFAGRLFGAFQRLHPATEFKGTGVGLATVQRIIHRHGGRIWAESQVGQGATFLFTLPQAKG